MGKTTSKPFSLNADELQSIAKGVAIAAAGAAITYLAEWASGTDFGTMTPVVVAVSASLVNAFRKWAAVQK